MFKLKFCDDAKAHADAYRFLSTLFGMTYFLAIPNWILVEFSKVRKVRYLVCGKSYKYITWTSVEMQYLKYLGIPKFVQIIF